MNRQYSRQPLKIRRGVTLIELIVVITTMAVITTLAVTTIFMLLRVEGEGAGSLSSALIESRLARQFRDDVRSATTAEVADDGVLKLKQGEQWIVYKPSDESISRHVQSDKDEPQAFDQFFIGKKTAKFSIVKQNAAAPISTYEMVHLAIAEPIDRKGVNKTIETKYKEHIVRATLSFDRRFLRSKEEVVP